MTDEQPLELDHSDQVNLVAWVLPPSYKLEYGEEITIIAPGGHTPFEAVCVAHRDGQAIVLPTPPLPDRDQTT